MLCGVSYYEDARGRSPVEEIVDDLPAKMRERKPPKDASSLGSPCSITGKAGIDKITDET